MYRSFEISVPPAATEELLSSLGELDQVISLSVERGASVKPPGDVITAHSLNSGAGDVLRVVEGAHEHGQVSIATADLASLIDREHAEAIVKDTDEALWEETEAGVRHQGRPTHNYLLLMAAGGAIAATGFLSTPPTQTIAFVSASVIAPGFEPLAKIPLGLVLGRPQTVLRGLRSALIGYLLLAVAAALAYLVLKATGATTLKNFLGNKEIDKLANPISLDILISGAAAVAGVIMVASRRFALLAGPLMALALIPSAAMAGLAAAAGEGKLIPQALERLGIDVALVVVLGFVVAGLKQVLLHRRRPLPSAAGRPRRRGVWNVYGRAQGQQGLSLRAEARMRRRPSATRRPAERRGAACGDADWRGKRAGHRRPGGEAVSDWLLFVVGLFCAGLSALGTNLSFLLKHRGALEAPDVDMRHPLRSTIDLFRSRWWTIGWAVAAVAFAAHVAALSMLSLSLAQAVLAGGFVLLAVLAERFFGFELGRRQWIGIFLVAGSLALIAVTGGGSDGHSEYSIAGMIFFEGGALALGLLCVLSHRIPALRARRGVLLGAAAGLGFGISDVAVKALSGDLDDGLPALVSTWSVLIVLAGVAAFFASARSLQVGEGLAVIAVTSVAANLSAIVAGVVVFGDPLGTDALVIIARVVAFLLVLVAAALMPAPVRAGEHIKQSSSGEVRPRAA